MEDAASKKPILDLVNAHIARNVKAHGHLVYSGVPGGRKREFTIVQVFDVVSLDEGVYTVQVDVDELRGKPRLLLFFGVIKEGGSYELKDVRLGPEHLRQVAAH